MRAVVAITLISLLLSACRPPKEFEADKLLTESDNGTMVNLKVGDKVVIRLNSNASTGYKWQMESGSPKVLGPNGAPKYSDSGSTAPGDGGSQDIPFLAKSEGTCVLKLVYRRQLETDVAQRWSATFIVSKK